MKIRMGFVSNSSSASYIVTLNKTFDTEESLLEDIYESCWCALQEEETRYFNEQELWDIRHPKDPNKTTIIKNELTEFWNNVPAREPYVRRHTTEDGTRVYIEDRTQKIEATRYTLNQLGISIDCIDGKYQLSYFTAMHNSFDDMNDLLKNIYFQYLAYCNGATFKIEDDD